MSFLRSSILLAVLSFVVLTGYGFEVLDDHCSDAKQEETHHGVADHDGVPADGAHDCQCLCHGIFPAQALEPVRVLARAAVRTESFVIRDEIPPETVPVGIEYPPQLT